MRRTTRQLRSRVFADLIECLIFIATPNSFLVPGGLPGAADAHPTWGQRRRQLSDGNRMTCSHSGGAVLTPRSRRSRTPQRYETAGNPRAPSLRHALSTSGAPFRGTAVNLTTRSTSESEPPAGSPSDFRRLRQQCGVRPFRERLSMTNINTAIRAPATPPTADAGHPSAGTRSARA